ncbi:NAD(P)H-dependent flavin oxidoreductase [Capillimicrobium parvum]|uniref:NADH:quinone reductase n=1 Tax=Capillimicrobium parvum TaxID=2884022 RepID=A0A9E6XSC3_9ACTN|nr:nitronate monooxygenase [Capillimicrobium parvum]UGS33860.1 NADH:quinone reductase [Capillimicrobium parvum]
MSALRRLLGCRVPIQQAGFGSSLNVDLVAAVAGAGAIGTVGAALASPAELEAALGEIRRRTDDGAVAVNFVEPFFDRAAHGAVLEVAAAGADLVEFFYGDPDAALIEAIHRGGARAGWQVGSVDEALAAAGCGVDVVAVQGIEAGGHVRATAGLLPMLAAVLDRVEVPVMAAGGIASPRAMAAALAAGAAGVRMGTRFVACAEADFHAGYKAALVAAGHGDTVYTAAFRELWPGAPHRVLRSAIAAAEANPAPVVATMSAGAERIDVPRFAGFAPVADADGDVAAMALFAGEGVGDIDDVPPAAEIVRRFADGAARLLGAMPVDASGAS